MNYKGRFFTEDTYDKRTHHVRPFPSVKRMAICGAALPLFAFYHTGEVLVK